MKHPIHFVTFIFSLLNLLACQDSLLPDANDSTFTVGKQKGEAEVVMTKTFRNDSLGVTATLTLSLIDHLVLPVPVDIFVYSEERLNALLKTDFYTLSAPKGDLIPVSWNGYQVLGEIKEGATITAAFDKELAAQLGLSAGVIYDCWVYQAGIVFQFSSPDMHFVQLPSPKCGFYPGEQTRGYRYYKLDDRPNAWFLYTNLYKAFMYAHDVLRNPVWAPCRPEDIVWDYGIN